MFRTFSGSATISITLPSEAVTRSPPRRISPRGSIRPTSSPDTRCVRSRLFWRASNGSFSWPRTSTLYAALEIFSFAFISSMKNNHPSKKKIPLRQGKHLGRLADQQLAVGAHLVGFRVNADFRLQTVVDH